MKKILFILFLFSKTLFACECPTLQPISKELSSSYNVIFFGKVDSVFSQNVKGKSMVYFTIHEVYKGSVQQNIPVIFDATSSCMMSFSKDEQWLIYGVFERFNELSVTICSHSRKLFDPKDASQDFYQLAAQRKFEEERQFLKTTLSIQAFAENNDLNQQQIDFGPHNDQPSATNKLLLLLVSLGAMLIVYFATRKK